MCCLCIVYIFVWFYIISTLHFIFGWDCFFFYYFSVIALFFTMKVWEYDLYVDLSHHLFFNFKKYQIKLKIFLI